MLLIVGQVFKTRPCMWPI